MFSYSFESSIHVAFRSPLTFTSFKSPLTSTAKKGSYYRKQAVNLYLMILVFNLYIVLVYCCTLFLLIFWYQPLPYASGSQPLHCTCSLLYYAMYWCTVDSGSVMNYACVMYTVSQKNASQWENGNNPSLERARRKSNTIFEN